MLLNGRHLNELCMTKEEHILSKTRKVAAPDILHTCNFINLSVKKNKVKINNVSQTYDSHQHSMFRTILN